MQQVLALELPVDLFLGAIAGGVHQAHGKVNIEGEVTNTATVANYKNVVIKISLYSETETLLSSEDHTLYDFFPAHSTKQFRFKINRQKHVKKLGIEVVTAMAY